MQHHTTHWSRSSTIARVIRHGQAIICGIIIAACADGGSQTAIPTAERLSLPVGILAAGDEIGLSFSGAAEMNTRRKIRPDGKVSLPTVGDVHAAGRSIASLQQTLQSLYEPHLQDSEVSVSLEQAAAAVYVSGEVLRPGKVSFDRPMTALEAIMEAGGFSKFADPKRVILIRRRDDSQQRYVLNLNDTLVGAESRPFDVRPYDVIYVSQSVW
jgi:polysaccharide export outer membrane protein